MRRTAHAAPGSDAGASANPAATTDVVTAVSESAQAAAAEVAQTAAAVAGSLPVKTTVLDETGVTATIANFINDLHVMLDMPWWAAIAATTVAVRLLIMPLNINSMAVGARMKAIQPQMVVLRRQVEEANASGSTHHRVEAAKQMRELFAKHKVGVSRMLVAPLVNLPTSLTLFWAVRNLATDGDVIEGFASGGGLWFPELHHPDPYFIIPAISVACALTSIQLNVNLQAQDQNVLGYTREQMTKFMRVLTVVFGGVACTLPAVRLDSNPLCLFVRARFASLHSPPFHACFPPLPQSVSLSFAVTSGIMVIQNLALRLPLIHKLFNFPEGYPGQIKPLAPPGMSEAEAAKLFAESERDQRERASNNPLLKVFTNPNAGPTTVTTPGSRSPIQVEEAKFITYKGLVTPPPPPPPTAPHPDDLRGAAAPAKPTSASATATTAAAAAASSTTATASGAGKVVVYTREQLEQMKRAAAASAAASTAASAAATSDSTASSASSSESDSESDGGYSTDGSAKKRKRKRR